jgi:hypothetical protein
MNWPDLLWRVLFLVYYQIMRIKKWNFCDSLHNVEKLNWTYILEMHRLKAETVHLYPFQAALPSTHGLRQKRRCGRVRGARTPSSSWRACRRRRCSCVRRVVEEEVEDVGIVATRNGGDGGPADSGDDVWVKESEKEQKQRPGGILMARRSSAMAELRWRGVGKESPRRSLSSAARFGVAAVFASASSSGWRKGEAGEQR